MFFLDVFPLVLEKLLTVAVRAHSQLVLFRNSHLRVLSLQRISLAPSYHFVPHVYHSGGGGCIKIVFIMLLQF